MATVHESDRYRVSELDNGLQVRDGDGDLIAAIDEELGEAIVYEKDGDIAGSHEVLDR